MNARLLALLRAGKGLPIKDIQRMDPPTKALWLTKLLSGAAYVIKTITGSAPLTLPNAVHRAIHSLTQYGLCTQASTPAPDAPVDIMCNNGALRYGALGANLCDPSAANTVLEYYINKADGEVKPSPPNFMFANYMPVEGGKTYVAYGRAKSGNDLSDYNRVAWYDSSKNWISGADYTQNRIAVVTAPANAAYARFSCNPTGTTTTTVTQELVDSYNWMFAEGTAEIIPFVPFEGGIYTQGTPETLTVADNYASGGLTGYGTYVSPTKAATTRAYKRLEVPNGTYQVAVDGDYEIIVQWRDPADQSVTAQSYENLTEWITSGEVTLDKPSGGYGISVRRTTGASQITFDNFDGTLFCCKTSDIQTVTDIPMLLSVGDTKDEAEIISGGVTHRVGIKVFDGTEVFGKSSAYGAAFYIQSAAGAWGAQKQIVMCSHYLGLATASSATAEGTCFFNASGHFYIRVADNSDTAAFKADLAEKYASGNPVILLYALSEETTEQGTPHSLHTSEGTNVVSVVSNVDPVELAVEYAGTA